MTHPIRRQLISCKLQARVGESIDVSVSVNRDLNVIATINFAFLEKDGRCRLATWLGESTNRIQI